MIMEVILDTIFLTLIANSLYLEREMVTPPLNGLILPGITRHSIIQMSEEWNKFKINQRVITMSEVVELLNSNRVSILMNV